MGLETPDPLDVRPWGRRRGFVGDLPKLVPDRRVLVGTQCLSGGGETVCRVVRTNCPGTRQRILQTILD